jgi:aldose 1-epimerase
MAPKRKPTAAIEHWRGEPGVMLTAGDYEAVFLPGLGMLGGSLTYQGTELVYLGGGPARYRAGHQTGFPLLAPWANRLATRRYRAAGVDVDLRRRALGTDENGLPIHGTMTAQRGWQIVRLEPGVLRTTFDYGARDDLLKAFPFPHALDLRVALSEAGLRVDVTVRPTGRRRVPVSFGWHPYFTVPGSRRSWTLELPPRRHLELDAKSIPTGKAARERAEREPLGTRTFDDGYALGSDRRFALEGDGRRLDIRFGSNYPFAQVFAPPRSTFVAIEPMTAPTNALATDRCPVVRPGQRFTASFTVAAS